MIFGQSVQGRGTPNHLGHRPWGTVKLDCELLAKKQYFSSIKKEQKYIRPSLES